MLYIILYFTAIRSVYCIEYWDCVVCSVCCIAPILVAMHGRGDNWSVEYC